MVAMNPVRSHARATGASPEDLGGTTSYGMKVDILVKNIELDGPLRAFVQERIGGLERLLGGAKANARVEIGKPSQHHRSGLVFYAEVNLTVSGHLLRVQTRHIDLRAAITDAKEGLRIQIKKFKEKRKDTSRKGRQS